METQGRGEGNTSESLKLESEAKPVNMDVFTQARKQQLQPPEILRAEGASLSSGGGEGNKTFRNHQGVREEPSQEFPLGWDWS